MIVACERYGEHTAKAKDLRKSQEEIVRTAQGAAAMT